MTILDESVLINFKIIRGLFNMYSLYLTDLIRKTGWNLNRVKLIRHATSHKRLQIAYENNVIREYTQMQKADFFKDTDYVIAFIGGKGTTARFVGCYEVTGYTDLIKKDLFSEKYPEDLLDSPPSGGTNVFHELKDTDHFKDLKERLYIDWGKGTVSWSQKGSNKKPIIGIGHLSKFTFKGYENIVLKFHQLEEILTDPIKYSEWETALKSVHAIYLITLLDTGKQYVGSASGQDSLFQRWTSYVNTKHGGNKDLKKLLDKEPERYKKFQFSLLQVIPKTMSPKEVGNLESLYKIKLGSKEFGLNNN